MKDYAKYTREKSIGGSLVKNYGSYILLFIVLVVIAYGIRSFFKTPQAAATLGTATTAVASTAITPEPLPSPTAISTTTPPITDSKSSEPSFDFYDMLSDTDEVALPTSSTSTSAAAPAVNSVPDMPPPSVSPTSTAVATTPKPPSSAVPTANMAPKSTTKAPIISTATSKNKNAPAYQTQTTSKKYVIELSTFTTYQTAQARRAELILQGLTNVQLVSFNTPKGIRYRLQMGPYDNWRKAHAAQLQLEQSRQLRGKILTL